MSLTRRGVGRLVLAGAVAAALPSLCGLVVASSSAAELPAPENFRFIDGAGAQRRLADIPARAFLLNFWATWCPPCVEEMPSLDRLHKLLAPDGIEVLPLSADFGRHVDVEVKQFYQRHNLTDLGIWLDRDRQGLGTYRVHGLPTSILTDRLGREIARVEGGAEWDTPEVVATIRRLVADAAVR